MLVTVQMCRVIADGLAGTHQTMPTAAVTCLSYPPQQLPPSTTCTYLIQAATTTYPTMADASISHLSIPHPGSYQHPPNYGSSPSQPPAHTLGSQLPLFTQLWQLLLSATHSYFTKTATTAHLTMAAAPINHPFIPNLGCCTCLPKSAAHSTMAAATS